ncbi:uncharacterized protein EAF02_003633 [Botrytis sinoallii]|uniref:uncharacterized protein n=1 Tax=Botrytis sinoallii TaxID=1463999 RepID=UPI0019029EE0|nr:uncharacterized protein EAF02_003633 [Botrytis sinoallii]KAF7886986.1 hypothetical protein EAF02_003633 [Botrytis sinoallii]
MARITMGGLADYHLTRLVAWPTDAEIRSRGPTKSLRRRISAQPGNLGDYQRSDRATSLININGGTKDNSTWNSIRLLGQLLSGLRRKIIYIYKQLTRQCHENEFLIRNKVWIWPVQRFDSLVKFARFVCILHIELSSLATYQLNIAPPPPCLLCTLYGTVCFLETEQEP